MPLPGCVQRPSTSTTPLPLVHDSEHAQDPGEDAVPDPANAHHPCSTAARPRVDLNDRSFLSRSIARLSPTPSVPKTPQKSDNMRYMNQCSWPRRAPGFSTGGLGSPDRIRRRERSQPMAAMAWPDPTPFTARHLDTVGSSFEARSSPVYCGSWRSTARGASSQSPASAHARVSCSRSVCMGRAANAPLHLPRWH